MILVTVKINVAAAAIILVEVEGIVCITSVVIIEGGAASFVQHK